MTNLVRKDPFWQELLDFRQSFDQMFNHFFTAPFGSASAETWMPPVDAYVDGGKYHLQIALPGVTPQQVNVQAQGNVLTVRGERSDEKQTARENYLQRELRYGQFERVMTLPESVVTDKLEASFENGVLHLTAPISEKALPRNIEIKALGSGAKTKTIAA
jgi:HSP20 family protein